MNTKRKRLEEVMGVKPYLLKKILGGLATAGEMKILPLHHGHRTWNQVVRFTRRGTDQYLAVRVRSCNVHNAYGRSNPGLALGDMYNEALKMQMSSDTTSGVAPAPLGICIISKNQGRITIPVRENEWETVKVLGLFTYQKGSVSYETLIKRREACGRRHVTRQDQKELAQIASAFATLHKNKPPARMINIRADLYRDSLRESLARIGNHSPLTPHPCLTNKEVARLFELGLSFMQSMSGKWHRAAASHGDARKANVLIVEPIQLHSTQEESQPAVSLIDQSGPLFADPGDDIGSWLVDEFFQYYVVSGKNPYIRERANLFLELYEEKSGDKGIRKAACIGFAKKAMLKMRSPFTDRKYLSHCGTFAKLLATILKDQHVHWLDE